MNNHLENKTVDPSPDQKWLNQKAARLGITLCKRHTASLPDVPKMLSDEINNFTKFAGGTKSLENIPKFGVEDIEKYFSSISKTMLKKSTAVKNIFTEVNSFWKRTI